MQSESSLNAMAGRSAATGPSGAATNSKSSTVKKKLDATLSQLKHTHDALVAKQSQNKASQNKAGQSKPCSTETRPNAAKVALFRKADTIAQKQPKTQTKGDFEEEKGSNSSGSCLAETPKNPSRGMMPKWVPNPLASASRKRPSSARQVRTKSCQTRPKTAISSKDSKTLARNESVDSLTDAIALLGCVEKTEFSNEDTQPRRKSSQSPKKRKSKARQNQICAEESTIVDKKSSIEQASNNRRRPSRKICPQPNASATEASTSDLGQKLQAQRAKVRSQQRKLALAERQKRQDAEMRRKSQDVAQLKQDLGRMRQQIRADEERQTCAPSTPSEKCKPGAPYRRAAAHAKTSPRSARDEKYIQQDENQVIRGEQPLIAKRDQQRWQKNWSLLESNATEIAAPKLKRSSSIFDNDRVLDAGTISNDTISTVGQNQDTSTATHVVLHTRAEKKAVESKLSVPQESENIQEKQEQEQEQEQEHDDNDKVEKDAAITDVAKEDHDDGYDDYSDDEKTEESAETIERSPVVTPPRETPSPPPLRIDAAVAGPILEPTGCEPDELSSNELRPAPPAEAKPPPLVVAVKPGNMQAKDLSSSSPKSTTKDESSGSSDEIIPPFASSATGDLALIGLYERLRTQISKLDCIDMQSLANNFEALQRNLTTRIENDPTSPHSVASPSPTHQSTLGSTASHSNKGESPKSAAKPSKGQNSSDTPKRSSSPITTDGVRPKAVTSASAALTPEVARVEEEDLQSELWKVSQLISNNMQTVTLSTGSNNKLDEGGSSELQRSSLKIAKQMEALNVSMRSRYSIQPLDEATEREYQELFARGTKEREVTLDKPENQMLPNEAAVVQASDALSPNSGKSSNRPMPGLQLGLGNQENQASSTFVPSKAANSCNDEVESNEEARVEDELQEVAPVE